MEFSSILSRFVGPGQPATADDLSVACGKGADTIRSYLRGQSAPDWPTMLLMLHFLPVEFAAQALRPAFLAGVYRVEGDCPPGTALREIIEGAASLAAAWADGRIDHTEWPEVEKELTEAQAAIAQFLAQFSATKGKV